MSDDPITRARAELEKAEAAARETLATASEVAQTGIEQTHEFLARQARERPLATLGIAAGVGLIIGLLLTNRRN